MNYKTTWTAKKLREAWVDYFVKNDHLRIPSSSLIPSNDPTLLFTTAGMVPFKDYFSGRSVPPSKRVVTIQKCIRTTDLESVGKTERHCSFFEMLGNFSFGDYFKVGAIKFAWEFSIKVLKLDPNKIYITVYEDDNEAEKIWENEIKIPKNKIIRLGKKDNWWGPAGEQGPCGPCTELYLDRGEDICKRCKCSDKSKCGPGGEGDRYMEYWNIVFNEFFSDSNKNLKSLPEKGIDTGAGLERILTLLNSKESIYETDEIEEIISNITNTATNLLQNIKKDKTKITYNLNNKIPIRIIADHIRSSCFSIADGIFPANTGRGYVVRRILRRALLYVRELGIDQPFLYLLVGNVVNIYKNFYPELDLRKSDIENRILKEEKKFLETLELGLVKWKELKEKDIKNKIFKGENAFLLYDTFGFPFELIEELCEKENLKLDKKQFDIEMEEQRKRSNKINKWKDINLPPLTLAPTIFVGYENYKTESKILAIIFENNILESCSVDDYSEKEIIIILDKTPFYSEGGGQIGDSGEIYREINSNKTSSCDVIDTQKYGSYIIHICKIKSGEIKVGMSVVSKIDEIKRKKITLNHSATHLLNNTLKNILGEHIVQTGSIVTDKYLRFDFSHSEKISDEKLKVIIQEVNDAINEKGKVLIRNLNIEEAKKEGAVATFGEKYGSVVRVVGMGEKNSLSLELCGGCHVDNTGDILYFNIIKESSPGSGNRRIEAITGETVKVNYKNILSELNSEIAKLNSEIKNKILNQNFQIDKNKINQKEVINDDKNFYTNIINNLSKLKDFVDDLYKKIENNLNVTFINDKINYLKNEILENEKVIKKLEKNILNSTLVSQIEIYRQKIRKIGNINILTLELENVNIEEASLLSDKIKEKSTDIIILIGIKEKEKCVLIFTSDKLALTKLANKINMVTLIKEVSKLIGGGGGGRSDFAQAGGKNILGMKDALNEAEKIIVINLTK